MNLLKNKKAVVVGLAIFLLGFGVFWFFGKDRTDNETTETAESQTVEQPSNDESLQEQEGAQSNTPQPTQTNETSPEPTSHPSGFTLPPTATLSGPSFTSAEDLASAQVVKENVSPGLGIYWYDDRSSGGYYQCHLYNMSTYEVYGYYGVGSGAEANVFFFDFFPESEFSEQSARSLISNNCPQNP